MTTRIEWVRNADGLQGETWNPIGGCSPVSVGCQNCYAARLASGRLKHRPLYQGLTRGGKWTGEIRFDEEILQKPLRWRKARTIFVCSMSDLFHKEVPDEFIDKVFAVMALNPQHTFQVLTKRAERMRDYMTKDGRSYGIESLGWGCSVDGLSIGRPIVLGSWPLPNVWLGVTVENQAAADDRIPQLLACPAAVRFLSCEPCLGPIVMPSLGFTGPQTMVDWVIAGAETGPRARPMRLDWARSLQDQCQAAGVPFFLKAVDAYRRRELDGRTWEEIPHSPACVC